MSQGESLSHGNVACDGETTVPNASAAYVPCPVPSALVHDTEGLPGHWGLGSVAPAGHQRMAGRPLPGKPSQSTLTTWVSVNSAAGTTNPRGPACAAAGGADHAAEPAAARRIATTEAKPAHFRTACAQESEERCSNGGSSTSRGS